MNYTKSIWLALLLVLGLYLPAARAGSRTEGTTHFDPREIAHFSKMVESALAKKGARVAIVARVGRPRNQLPEGINYTHIGFAVYSMITLADGRRVPGYAMFNLYQSTGRGDRSELVQDYPLDFFSTVEILEAGVIIPSPKLQKLLLEEIASPGYRKLHNPRYSVIANPYATDFQNCTVHTLDVIMAAIYHTQNVRVIKADEKRYFKAQPITVNPLELAAASIFSPEVAISDQGSRPVTATFETIGRFLAAYDSGTKIFTITPSGVVRSL